LHMIRDTGFVFVAEISTPEALVSPYVHHWTLKVCCAGSTTWPVFFPPFLTDVLW
jgi:hypothetical protein